MLETILKQQHKNIKGIIHIGAHYGEEVPLYLKHNVKDIVLFEPLKVNFLKMKQNLANAIGNIEYHQVGLGNSNETKKMFLSSNQQASSSFLKPKLHLSLHPEVAFNGYEEVEVKKLDNYDYKDFNFLNIDVQGFELEVLKGAQQTLQYVDFIYIEVSRDELYEENTRIEQIDAILSQFKFQRINTIWMNSIWGEAFYQKVIA